MYDNAWLLQHQSTCMRVDKPRQTYSERRDNPPSTPLQRPLRGSARSSKRFLKHFAYRTVESMKVYCRRGLYSNSGSTRSQTFRTILSGVSNSHRHRCIRLKTSTPRRCRNTPRWTSWTRSRPACMMEKPFPRCRTPYKFRRRNVADQFRR